MSLTFDIWFQVQGPGVQKQIYRNTEPPSVVERNARIIKWLCQCRKTQMQAPQWNATKLKNT